MKKHVSQMNKAEKKHLIKRFKSIPESQWKFNPYSRKRALERGVDYSVLRTIWTDGFDLVEFNFREDKEEVRILVRSVATDENDNQVCAVFNFTKMEVTTVYLNWRKNKHTGLVVSEYNPDMDILEVV